MSILKRLAFPIEVSTDWTEEPGEVYTEPVVVLEVSITVGASNVISIDLPSSSLLSSSSFTETSDTLPNELGRSGGESVSEVSSSLLSDLGVSLVSSLTVLLVVFGAVLAVVVKDFADLSSFFAVLTVPALAPVVLVTADEAGSVFFVDVMLLAAASLVFFGSWPSVEDSLEASRF